MMARRPFGGSAATVLVDQTGVNGGATVIAWATSVGGVQITDLQKADGTPLAGGVLVADNNGLIPEFLGPADGTDELYLDAGLGRVLVPSNDLARRIRSLEQLVATGTNGGGGGGTTTAPDTIDGGTV